MQRDSTTVVVEPRFRDQFLIANPTPDFACLLDNLPEVFVGPQQRLRSVVEALCPIVAKTFASKKQVRLRSLPAVSSPALHLPSLWLVAALLPRTLLLVSGSQPQMA